jgi:hypothetical protein
MEILWVLGIGLAIAVYSLVHLGGVVVKLQRRVDFMEKQLRKHTGWYDPELDR